MKKELKSVLIVLLGLPFWGCSNDTTLEPDGYLVDRNSENSDGYFANLEEALCQAEQQFASLTKGGTRSSRHVKSVELYGVKTRGAESEPYGYYVVNYEDGFAILSADKRRNPVYALSETGSVDLADTTYNEGLRWYVDNVMDAPLTPQGGIFPFPDPEPINPGWGEKTETTVVCEPLLKGMLKSMHQLYPFNKYMPVFGDKAYAGCVGIAMLTYFGYCQWPTEYAGIPINWSVLLNDPMHDTWGQMILNLSYPGNLDYSFKPEGTGASETRILPTFKNWGYKYGTLELYKRNDIQTELSGNMLVIMGGRRTNEKGDHVGHEWICDGCYVVTTKTYQGPITEDDPTDGYVTTTSDYYHMRWGWGSAGNGYYLLGQNNPEIYPDEGKLDPGSGKPNLTYDYGNLTIIWGMRPNK